MRALSFWRCCRYRLLHSVRQRRGSRDWYHSYRSRRTSNSGSSFGYGVCPRRHCSYGLGQTLSRGEAGPSRHHQRPIRNRSTHPPVTSDFDALTERRRTKHERQSTQNVQARSVAVRRRIEAARSFAEQRLAADGIGRGSSRRRE